MDLFPARLGWISSPKNSQKVFTNWWGTQCDDWWTIFELDEIFGFSSSSENQVFFWPWSLWVSQGRWSDGHSEKKLWAADDQEKATEIHRVISITLHPFVTVTRMKWTRGFPRIFFSKVEPSRSSVNDRNISPPDTCTKWWISTLLYRWFLGYLWKLNLSWWGRFTGSYQWGARSYDPCQAVLAVKGLKDVSLEDVKGRTTEMGWGASYEDRKQRKKK